MATPRKKTPEEMALQSAIKVERSSVRLKKSLEADYELNDSIARIVEDFSALQTAGKSIRITTDFGGAGVQITAGDEAEAKALV